MSISDLPALNAGLNSVATLLLLTGYFQIRKKNIAAHKWFMISAFGVSALFLISYLIYHFNTSAVTKFTGQGAWRPIYYTMLASHIILAAAVPVLCLMTLYRAARGQFDKHRTIAKITFPIWLYVSVTGVLIYCFLYQWWPVPTT